MTTASPPQRREGGSMVYAPNVSTAARHSPSAVSALARGPPDRTLARMGTKSYRNFPRGDVQP